MSQWYLRSGFYTNEINKVQNIKNIIVTNPTLSIVSLSETKNYIKVSDSTDDDLIEMLINTAIAKVEYELGGISLCEQTWRQTQKGGCKKIKLLRQPIVGVPTVSYYEEFDTITATNITYTTHFRIVQPNELHHVDGYFDEGRDGDGYTITYNCGLYNSTNYNNTSDTKLNVLKTVIMRLVGYAYDNRAEYITNQNEGGWSITIDKGGISLGIKELLMPFNSGENLI